MRVTGRLAVGILALAAAPARAEDDAAEHGGAGAWREFPRLVLDMGAERMEEAELHVFPGDQGRALVEGVGNGAPGGAAVPHHSGARAAQAPSRVPSGSSVSTGNAAVEPSLGVGPDGTLYYVGTRNGASLVQRSTDNGATWQILDRLAPGVPDDTVTADPLINVDERTGRLLHFDYTPPCSIVSFSDDRGDTFSTGLACNHFDH